MAHRALRAGALVGLLLRPAALDAAEPSVLVVDVSVCPDGALDAREVARAVRAELDLDGVVRTSANRSGSDGTLSTSIDCDAAVSAVIRLRAASGRTSERQLVLADAAPSARPNLVALLAAELVRAAWTKLAAVQPSAAAYPAETKTSPAAATAPSPVATPKPTPPSTPREFPKAPRQRDTIEPPVNAQRAWTAAAELRLRWFVDYSSLALGGAGGADRGAWRFRAEALFSSTQDTLGDAAVGMAACGVGYRVLDTKLGPVALASYPMLAAGVTWMRGTAAASSIRVEPDTGVYADVRLVGEARLADSRLSPTLAVELGRATGFVARADGRALGASGGFFVGAQAGARY